MASEFTTFLRLGLGHITDLQGYDHILFIVALTASYGPKDWRPLAWLVTAFTLGHSLTLALATLDLVQVHGPTIELLIAVTIVGTAALAFASSADLEEQGKLRRGQGVRYAMAGGFGLIHGLGFSSFLRSALGYEEGIFFPLLAFNVGLEVGQLLIVAIVLIVGALAVSVAKVPRKWWIRALSTVVVAFGVFMIWERISGLG